MGKAVKAGARIGGAAALALWLTAAASAREAPLRRAPVERQVLIQIAYVLGEAHALHRLCAGPEDATWYDRMERLEAEEGADEGFRQRLVGSFNAGFASRQAEFPTCGPASQAAERRVAAHGAALSRRLSGGGEE